MGKRVYWAARTDPLRAMIEEQENRRRQQQLTDLFNEPPPSREPRPESEHVHGRGVDYLAGYPECQTINRAYYHAHKTRLTRRYNRKT